MELTDPKKIVEYLTGWAKRTFFERSVFRQTSNGASSANLPVATGPDGYIDASFFHLITLTDANFTLVDDGDATKKFKLQLSGITTGTTRTWTVPDSSDTFVGKATTDTLANKTLTAPTVGDFTNATHAHDSAAHGGTVAHTSLSSIGTNSHAQIDTALALGVTNDATAAAHIAATAAHGATGAVAGTTNAQLLTNKAGRTGTFTIANNNVSTYDTTTLSVREGLLFFSIMAGVDTTVGGLLQYRANGTPFVVSLVSASNTNVTTGALSGTTGAAGKFTVSVDTAGLIYFENQRGTSVTIVFQLIG